MFTSIGIGFCLGGSITIISYTLDHIIAKTSYETIQQSNKQLYKEAWHNIIINMMVISPVLYSLVHHTLLDHNNPLQLQPYNIISIVGIHSVGYYVIHRLMHTIPMLYSYHNFHHKFDKVLLPSIGNAVSQEEFLAAYAMPFITGAFIMKPNELSFMIPIGLISFFNLFIHTQELVNLNYPWFLVSPANHSEHHDVRKKHYAAPILNLDAFIDKACYCKKEIKKDS